MISLCLQVLELLQGALQDQVLTLLPVICVTGAQMTHHLPDDLRRPMQPSSLPAPTPAHTRGHGQPRHHAFLLAGLALSPVHTTPWQNLWLEKSHDSN